MFETSTARECADPTGRTSVFLLPWKSEYVFRGSKERRAAIDRWPAAFEVAIEYLGVTSAATAALAHEQRAYGPRRAVRFVFTAWKEEEAELGRIMCRHAADSWLRKMCVMTRGAMARRYNPTIGGVPFSAEREAQIYDALASPLDDDACDAMHAVLDDWGMP